MPKIFRQSGKPRHLHCGALNPVERKLEKSIHPYGKTTEHRRCPGKKILTGLLVLAFSLQVIGFSFPETARAQGVVPTNDKLNLVKNTATAFATNAQKVKDYMLDNLAYTIAKGIARQLTSSIVNWINSGFNGSPAFVSNPEQFLLNTADRIAGDLIEGSELGFLCDPFRLDIRIALGLKYRPFYDKVTCTFSEVMSNVKGSVAGFTNGNFRNGGWSGWLALTNQPQNNVYGAYLESQNELEIRIAGKRILETEKLKWGGGFLSWQKCEEQPVEYAPTGLQNYYENVPSTRTHCEIQTPGSVINGQLNKALGGALDQLNLADEFNEIINALVVQMISQVAGGGANHSNSSVGNTGGLRGASAQATGGGASLTSDLTRIQDNISLKNILSGIKLEIDNLINNETQYIQTKTASKNLLQATEDSVTALKTCYNRKITGEQSISQNQVTNYCLIGNQQYQGSDCNTYTYGTLVQNNTRINGLTTSEEAIATNRMNAAIAKINEISALKTPIVNDISAASTVELSLKTLRTNIETALLQNEIFINPDGSLRTDLSPQDRSANIQLLGNAQQLVNQYQATSGRNDLHREDKLLEAVNEKDNVISPQMASITNGTAGNPGTPGITAQLDTCTAFPFADRQTQGGWGITF